VTLNVLLMVTLAVLFVMYVARRKSRGTDDV